MKQISKIALATLADVGHSFLKSEKIAVNSNALTKNLVCE